MKKIFIILSLTILSFCHNFHHEKHNFKQKIFEKMNHSTQDEFEKETHRLSEIAKKINRLRTTWQATEYKRDFRPFLGSITDGIEKLPEKQFEVKNLKLPENYDAREAYPNCETIKEIRDQANCGSCWAFSTAEVMSDRICIASGQTDQRRISAKNILACCSDCGWGCSGGAPSYAFKYWKNIGVVTGGLYGDKTTCQPYFLPPCSHNDDESTYSKCPSTTNAPSCVKDCSDGNGADYNSDISKGSSVYSIEGEENIMQEIYEVGPVQATFDVYEDFLTYKSGVFQHVTGYMLGGHAIKIIGWGVEDGVKYWLCANSWNEGWGDNGFFKILRGNNECGIENNINAGVPIL